MTRRPVHDRDQVEDPAPHRDVGDIGAPNMIGTIHRHIPQKIRINPVRRVRRAGSRRLVDGLQAHEPHQPPNPVTAGRDAFPPQLACHLAAAVEGIFEKQLVDAAHQRQSLRALPLGRIIERGPADRNKPALTAQAQARAIGRDHRLAFPPAHRLSPPAKKSRSTVN